MQMEYEKPSVEVIDFYAMRMLANSGMGGGFESAEEGVGGSEEGGRPGGRPRGREE